MQGRVYITPKHAVWTANLCLIMLLCLPRDFEELDICDGHPSPFNQYHHHHYAHCIVQPVCGEPSPIVGVAIDGIPIYGPWDESGRQLTQQVVISELVLILFFS